MSKLIDQLLKIVEKNAAEVESPLSALEEYISKLKLKIGEVNLSIKMIYYGYPYFHKHKQTEVVEFLKRKRFEFPSSYYIKVNRDSYNKVYKLFITSIGERRYGRKKRLKKKTSKVSWT